MGPLLDISVRLQLPNNQETMHDICTGTQTPKTTRIWCHPHPHTHPRGRFISPD